MLNADKRSLGNNKMADESVDSILVLNDLLCYVRNKFDRVPIKTLKCSIVDFYPVDVIVDAKVRLLYDIEAMKSSTVKVPHVPRRRDGENRIVKEVDDIFLLICHLDEYKMLQDLPRYVAAGPDNMPSIRLYEGDLNALMAMMKQLTGKIAGIESALSAITHDVYLLKASQSASTIGQLSKSQRDINRGSSARQQQQTSHPVSLSSASENCGVTGVISTSTVFAASALDNERQDMQLAMESGPNWASLTSTPVISENRFAALATTDDESELQPFTTVLSRRSKRKPSGSHQQQQQQQTKAVAGENRRQQRRGPLLLGKAASRSNITAAKLIRKKVVFYIDNVNVNCSVADIMLFLKKASIQVITCFEVRPRRRYHQDECNDRTAFRLCVSEDDRDRLLDAEIWPDSVSIYEWYFKPPNSDDKRRRVEKTPSTDRVAAEVRDCDAPQVTSYDGDSTDVVAAAAVNVTGDDTVIADYNMDSMVSMDNAATAAVGNHG